MKETEQIFDLDLEIAEKRALARELATIVKDLVEGTDEYKAVLTLSEQLKLAKQKLKVELMGDASFNNAMEQLAEARATLADLKDILSAHLLEYVIETRERSIEVGSGETRAIVTKAALGKTEPASLSMFRGKVSVTVGGASAKS